jgi:hypothetical protein
MTGQSPPPFTLIISGYIGSELDRLGRKAASLQLLEPYLAALRTMHESLSHDPANWGEYKNHLPDLALNVYHRVQGMISIHYAVDESRRRVYVTRVAPLPSSPLGQGE